jgi:hypothetical protein
MALMIFLLIVMAINIEAATPGRSYGSEKDGIVINCPLWYTQCYVFHQTISCSLFTHFCPPTNIEAAAGRSYGSEKDEIFINCPQWYTQCYVSHNPVSCFLFSQYCPHTTVTKVLNKGTLPRNRPLQNGKGSHRYRYCPF